MPPVKARLNTTTPGGRGVRLNQSRRKVNQNSILGSSAKNKSFLYGKIKRNSQNLRKNNIALAKALNASKQKNSELTALAMQYRERAHTAERQAQQLQLLKQDLKLLLNQYSDASMLQDESTDSSQEPLLQISLPQRTGNEDRLKSTEYHPAVKEARTQLVNPMVQGLSINKVKVRLERINDVPRTWGQSQPDSDTNTVSDQRSSVQDIAVTDSPVPSAEVSLEDNSLSPVEDITVDLTMVQNLRRGDQFSNSLRVPSLTLQRLSVQDIQRTTSATYMAETFLEVSSASQSPRDQSAAVQLGQSMFPVEGERISSRQSAHETVDKPRDSLRMSDSPKKGGEVAQQSALENPLEGTSWMYDTNRLSKRIRVRSRRSVHQKPAKRESTKKRYNVKNLAAEEDFACPNLNDFSPPSVDEAALQDMSLTLCLPLSAVDRGTFSEMTKPPQLVPLRTSLDTSVPVTDEDASDLQVKVTRKSPTVTVTRLFNADILRLSVARNNSSSADDICPTSPGATIPGQEISDMSVGDVSGAGDSVTDSLPSPRLAKNHVEIGPGTLTVDEDTAAGDTSQALPGDRGKYSECVKVVLKRVDNETVLSKPSNRSNKRSRSKSVKAPVLHLPRRQVKKVEPGTYKEPSLGRKLRR